VAAHAPCDRFIRISAVMPEVTVEIAKTVTEIKKRQEIKDDVAPIEEEHDEEDGGKRRQLDISPNPLATSALAQFLPNRSNIIAEETEKHVAPRIFGFAVMAVLINRNPIDGLPVLIGPIGVAFVMLHVDGIVVGLRKTTRDRLHDSKKPIEERRPEEWIVDEVMSDAVDVCVHH